MKKILISLCAVCSLLLAGCKELSGSLQEELNERVQSAITSETASPNYSHGTYSYYREPTLGRISSEETSNTFTDRGVKFVMNLKVSTIINDKFYNGESVSSAPKDRSPSASASGTFIDYAGKEHPYSIVLYELDDDVYTYAETDLVEFFAISTELQALHLSETMLRLARTISVDPDAVVAAYSSRQTIEYSRKRLELFHNIVPENGVIDELFEGNGNFAGQYDGGYYGDNIGDNPEGQAEQGDTITGDADDNIGATGDNIGDNPEGAHDTIGTETSNPEPTVNPNEAGDTEETLPPEEMITPEG